MFSFKYGYVGISRHTIHSYPAKFPPFVPKQLIDEFLKKPSVILDPFSGCGTTLLEGLLKGHEVIGNDINHIANLIAEVKLSKLNKKTLKELELIKNQIGSYDSKDPTTVEADFHNKDHWFQLNVQQEIQFILNAIDFSKDKLAKLIAKTSLSEIIIKVSNQESDTRYEAINKNIKNFETIKYFQSKIDENINKLHESNDLIDPKIDKKILFEDTRNLISVSDNSIDLIITSPPYANTYDYYLYHKQRMNWLNYNFHESKKLEIGSRLQYSSKKDDVSVWKRDIYSFLMEFKRMIKKNKHIAIVIGDSVINKKLFDAKDCIEEIAKENSLHFEYSVSESLKNNSKKFNHKFRTKIDKKEHLIILRK